MGLSKEHRNQLRQMLSADSVLSNLLDLIEAERVDLQSGFLSFNFSTVEGAQGASELKGKLLGLARLRDIIDEELEEKEPTK